MDFANIYKSRKIILEMLKLRGSDISVYENQTKEELNILYQQHGNKSNNEMDTLDILVSKTDDDSKIMIKYLTNTKVRNQNIINCIDEIYESKLIENKDVLVIITKDKVNYQGSLEEYINRIYLKDKIFCQILCLSNLLFNITEHELVPKYRIMSHDEKEQLIKKLYLENENQLPFILITDPVAQFYGVKLGEVCEIEYNNHTNGKNKFYRLCVASN